MDHRFGRSLIAFVFSIGMCSLEGAPPASAYTLLGCKYPGSNPQITYSYGSMLQALKTAWGAGQSAWDQIPNVPGNFLLDQSNPDPMINVRGASYSWGAWAVTSGSCSGGTWYSNEVTIQFNQRTMGGLTAWQKQLVATHEGGHALGLNHMPDSCGSNKAVMQQHEGKFRCGSTPPWQDDINGINALY